MRSRTTTATQRDNQRPCGGLASWCAGAAGRAADRQSSCRASTHETLKAVGRGRGRRRHRSGSARDAAFGYMLGTASCASISNAAGRHMIRAEAISPLRSESAYRPALSRPWFRRSRVAFADCSRAAASRHAEEHKRTLDGVPHMMETMPSMVVSVGQPWNWDESDWVRPWPPVAH